jgi:lysophospholipase
MGLFKMTSKPFNPSKNHKRYSDDALNEFWSQGHFSHFKGIKCIDIHYAVFTQKNCDSAALVIVPGRSEGYLKYQELALDFYMQGYSIFIIDHRGQGLSGRLLNIPNKGYVEHFQDYIDDLHYFIESIVTKFSSTKPFLLAHSMGGAIATRYMQDFPTVIKAAVISSPMLGFNSGLLPKTLAKFLVGFSLLINKIFSKTPWYFWGQGDYVPSSFAKNKLSHSAPRYQCFIDLYQKNKKLQLGGVTTHWLAQSIIAQKEIMFKLAQLKTPILLLQAGSDSIVCQEAQSDFCQRLHAIQPQSCPNGTPSKIDGAYHEIFFELNKYRDEALRQTNAWFVKYQ